MHSVWAQPGQGDSDKSEKQKRHRIRRSHFQTNRSRNWELFLSLVPKLASSFWVFRRKFSWFRSLIKICEIFGWKAIAISLRRLADWNFCALLLEHPKIWGRPITFRWSSALDHQMLQNVRTFTYWNRINRHFWFWEKEHQQMKFRSLGIGSSAFCSNLLNRMISYKKRWQLSSDCLACRLRWLKLQ